jgi:hypothetical protein
MFLALDKLCPSFVRRGEQQFTDRQQILFNIGENDAPAVFARTWRAVSLKSVSVIAGQRGSITCR